MHVHMYACMYVCTYVCMYVLMYYTVQVCEYFKSIELSACLTSMTTCGIYILRDKQDTIVSFIY